MRVVASMVVANHSSEPFFIAASHTASLDPSVHIIFLELPKATHAVGGHGHVCQYCGKIKTFSNIF